jgi:hypothetical protein
VEDNLGAAGGENLVSERHLDKECTNSW